jgi:nicotinamide mononucleotide (NMN) deamidase PncC
MAFRVLEVQSTPNPNAHKFVLDQPITDRPLSYFTAESAVGNAIAERLFAIPGVSSLLLLGDFVTINKSSAAKWADINGKVKKVLLTS